MELKIHLNEIELEKILRKIIADELGIQLSRIEGHLRKLFDSFKEEFSKLLPEATFEEKLKKMEHEQALVGHPEYQAILSRLELPKAGQGGRIATEIRKEIAEMKHAGAKDAEIVKKYGISLPMINRIHREYYCEKHLQRETIASEPLERRCFRCKLNKLTRQRFGRFICEDCGGQKKMPTESAIIETPLAEN